MNWTARTAGQKAEAIRDLLEQGGMSFTQAAKHLGTTRLAVAGVAHRNGIEAHGGKPVPRPTAASAAPPPPSSAWRALPGTDPRPVEQHHEGECRWPLGERPFRFCCAPVQPGKVYCQPHAELGLRPAPPIKFNGKRKQ